MGHNIGGKRSLACCKSDIVRKIKDNSLDSVSIAFKIAKLENMHWRGVLLTQFACIMIKFEEEVEAESARRTHARQNCSPSAPTPEALCPARTCASLQCMCTNRWVGYKT
ncbi:hypothetical protein ACH5RR_037230 [Cinchona calisaya]|uniref:Uncharacterized protein n=1 Tax=Cinchona calisaya TaxID=153742 RepID=A0ABD2Y7T6_9GENT